MDSKTYILSSVKEKIRRIDPQAKIILFGSRARNDYREDSDWDFLILTKLDITRKLKNEISDVLFETELETESVLTGIVQDINSWNDYSCTPIYKNISIEGVEV